MNTIEPVRVTAPCGLLATGWLSAFLATSTDEEAPPILWKTLCIEAFPTGLRFTSTDRYTLFMAWVPSKLDEPEPPLDVVPDLTLTCRDPDARAKGLMTYLRKVATRAAKDDIPVPDVEVTLNVEADEHDVPGFPGMERRQVLVEFPGNEAVRLDVVEGSFPDWRSIVLGHEKKATDRVSLNPEFVSRIGALGKLLGGFLTLRLSGSDGSIAIEPSGEPGGVAVRGVLMPVRTPEDSGIAA